MLVFDDKIEGNQRHLAGFVCIQCFVQQQKDFIRIINTLSGGNMRAAAVISHAVKQPYALPIKVVTEFEPVKSAVQPKNDCLLARLFLYTQTQVYRGQLLKGDLNVNLAWNDNSLSTLLDSLNGKRPNYDIRFSQINGAMSLICQIQTKIRITMFEIVLSPLQDTLPLDHMKTVILSYMKMYTSQENTIKQQKDRILSEVKETLALNRQIEEQTQTQVLHLKKNFVEVVNQCKKQLRRHMKTGISEIAEEEEEEETMTRGRMIVKVDREALDRVMRQKEMKSMELEEDGQKGFDALFDEEDN